MRESEGINEDDPKQMATLMRKFTERTGINLGDNMEEAISRMERGEDPEQIEKDMGDLMDDEDFSFEAIKKKAMSRQLPPAHDETLYDLHSE
jgi:predicted DNA-binding helix-hairpin-helix protein